jgi:hypothetical protein
MTKRIYTHLNLAGLALVSVCLGGCVTATVQQVRETATSVSADDSIVILGRRNRPSSAETEIDFVDCVSKNVSSGGETIRVISEQQFVDAMFPWFEPRTAPLRNTDLPGLINQPLLAERIREIGLKYLIWIEGSTQRTNSTGTMSCSLAPGGGGCFGFLSWENDSSYEASVWDAHTGRTAGRVSSDAAGTSYMPALVVPIPIIARVRNSACVSLAEQLRSFVQNEV